VFALFDRFEHVISLVTIAFLVFAGVFVFGGVKATASFGPPIVEKSQEWNLNGYLGMWRLRKPKGAQRLSTFLGRGMLLKAKASLRMLGGAVDS